MNSSKGLIQDHTSIAQQKSICIPRTMIPESVPLTRMLDCSIHITGEKSPRPGAGQSPIPAHGGFSHHTGSAFPQAGGPGSGGEDNWGPPPASPGTFQKKPFTQCWFGWFGANPSPALISVAQLSCHGDRAHCAKLGEKWW